MPKNTKQSIYLLSHLIQTPAVLWPVYSVRTREARGLYQLANKSLSRNSVPNFDALPLTELLSLSMWCITV